jgi:hypothetical protein
MIIVKKFDYSLVAAGISRSANTDHKNSKATVGPKEDFIQGIFFTAGSLLITALRDYFFPVDKPKKDS